MQFAILDSDNNVIELNSMVAYADWRAANAVRCIVEKTDIDRIRVSTVFLAVNHGSEKNPLWFETMVFTYTGDDIHCARYMTWNAALEGHHLVVKKFQNQMHEAYKSVGRTIETP